MHDFDHGVAGLVVEFDAPEVFKPLVIGLVVDPLIVGEHHGNQTRIAGTLHIVLATQRVQARARLADLAGHGNQRNQAARIVSAVHVLAYAHAPQNHRAFSFGKFACHLTQCLCRNAAYRRHGFGAVSLDVFTQGFKVACTVANEILIRQALINDGMNQGVEHGHIGVRLELQCTPGVLA